MCTIPRLLILIRKDVKANIFFEEKKQCSNVIASQLSEGIQIAALVQFRSWKW